MWKSIINEKKEQVNIHDKIDDIYEILMKKMNEIKNFDLYMGKSGICLFFAYYQTMNKQRPNNIEDVVESLINDAIQYKYRVSSYRELTFYSEMAWFLCHLHERKLIYIELNDYFSDIDDSLYEGMIILLNSKEKEYGCINGAISVGVYFYYRYILGCEKCKKYLERFVDLLKKIAVEKDNTMKWISIIDYGTYEQGYNLGLAHGISGILLFLRKLYLANIKKDAVSDIIIKASNFLLLQKHSLKTHKSFFYDVCKDSFGRDSRLGWCYGDMSVGYSLFMISSLDGIERQDVKENAFDILVNTTERTNLSDIGIVDAGLCHGTSGIAHIYNRLYRQTSETKFKDAALYWYKETIKMAKYDNEYAGYRLPYYLAESEKEFRELHNLSFLTGIAGTGLSLLSAIYPIEPSWDMCLLLS
jgi:lantibiotic modifying enzyme